MDIQTKDGILLRNVPDGTPEEQIKARIAKIRAERGTAAPAATPKQPATYLERSLGTVPGRALLGASEILTGPFQLGANVGDYLAEKMGLPSGGGEQINQWMAELEAMKRRGMEAGGADPDSMDFAGMAGNIASGAPLLKGSIKAGTTAGRKIWQGVKTGTIFGGAQPVKDGGENFAQDKAVQAGTGLAFGGGIPLVGTVVGKGAGLVKNLGRDIFETVTGNINAPLHRGLRQAIGPEDLESVRRALRAPHARLPGAPAVSSAEATAGTPGGSVIAAIDQNIATMPGGPSARYAERAMQSQEARRKALQAFAGDEAKLAQAVAARDKAANQLYDEAFKQPVQRDAALKQLEKNPFFADALKDAAKLAKAEGNPGGMRILHLVKLSLDDQLKRAPTNANALSNTQRRAVYNVKKQLVNWMESKSPAYAAARKTYAEMSAPINQMEVGQGLLKKLTAPTGKESPGTYLRAVADEEKLIKNSLGMSRSDLGKVLTPEQKKIALDVAKDLERQLKVSSPIQRTTMSGNFVEKSAIPNPLIREIMVIRNLLQKMERGQSPELNAAMVKVLRDPEALAKALDDAPTDKARSALVNALRAAEPYSRFGTVGAPVELTNQ